MNGLPLVNFLFVEPVFKATVPRYIYFFIFRVKKNKLDIYDPFFKIYVFSQRTGTKCCRQGREVIRDRSC